MDRLLTCLLGRVFGKRIAVFDDGEGRIDVCQRHHLQVIGTQQIGQLYLRLYARPANNSELRDASGFLEGDASLVDLCRAMLNSNEFLYVD